MNMDMEHEAEAGQIHTWTVQASYGVSSWLTVGLLLPFTYKAQEVAAHQGEATRSTGGMGDPMLLVKATMFGHDNPSPRAVRLGLTAGVKFPLGRRRDGDEFGTLPPGFQVSSGAFDLIAGAFGSWGFLPKTQLFGSVLYRHSTENDQQHSFGDGVVATLDTQSVHLYPVAITGGVRLTANGADLHYDRPVDGSRASILWAHLGLTVYVSPRFFINLDGVVPFFRDLEGASLTTSGTWLLGLTFLR